MGLVSRAYLLDFMEGNSFVARLLDAGFETYVLDWGEPDEADAGNTLETYVENYLPRAIDAVRQNSGSDDVSIIGYCMGGCLALMGLAGQPHLPVRNLVTLATPLDFRHMGPLVDALREGRLDVEDMLDETGNLPGRMIESFFKIRKPTADLVQYANLWEHLWNDEYVRGYQAMGRWIRDQVPVAGGAARQVVGDWMKANAFCTDSLRLNGRQISLGDIRVPTLAVIATRDEIVPDAAATPVVDLLTGTRVETLRLDAGHASLTTGRAAAKVTLPRIIEWLTDHSEEVT
jgi:polyhydroxyalkanoate synthase